MSPEEYLIKNVLLPVGGKEGWCAPRDVLIRDGVIAAVEEPQPGGSAMQTEAASARRVISCDGETHLLIPGMHNAHTHSSNFFIKGGLAPLPLELMVACGAYLPESHVWKAEGIGYGAKEGDQTERYRLGALATGLHTLLSGATSLVDMISLPGDEEGAMRCLVAAAKGYRQSGCRVFLGPQFDDSKDGEGGVSGKTVNFLAPATSAVRASAAATMAADGGLRGLDADGGLHADRWPTDPAKTRLAVRVWRRAILELHRPEDGVHIVLAPHNERTCSRELFLAAAALMREFPGVFATTHLLEGLHQPIAGGADTEGDLSASVRVLDECGFLTERTTLAHCVHLTAADMRLLAERGCVVSHNPVSNLRLGAGIADVLAMRRAGCRVGIGVDGHGSGVEYVCTHSLRRKSRLDSSIVTPDQKSIRSSLIR